MKKICLFVGCAAVLIWLVHRGTAEREWPRGWYCAGSRIADPKALGGFGPCDNFAKECVDGNPGNPGELSLIAYPGEVVDFGNRKALLLHLLNRTENTVAFAACDSRLYIVQEAVDDSGAWRPIERFPWSFCGNSYHRVFLEPDQYWEFFAQPRRGSFPTKLRFRLVVNQGEKGMPACEPFTRTSTTAASTRACL